MQQNEKKIVFKREREVIPKNRNERGYVTFKEEITISMALDDYLELC